MGVVPTQSVNHTAKPPWQREKPSTSPHPPTLPHLQYHRHYWADPQNDEDGVMDEYQTFAGDRADLKRFEKIQFSRKIGCHFLAWIFESHFLVWRFGGGSQKLVQPSSTRDHESTTTSWEWHTPNKCPYHTTKQLISAKWIYNIYTIKDMRGPRLLFLQLPSHPATISSHHPNIYTIKDMRGRRLPFLQLPSHQPKRGERNQCLWFLPHLWLHGHYRANIIVIDNVRIHLQVKSSSSPYPLQHQP